MTDWILPAQRSMEKAAAGLFFYDMRYRQMLLTEQAREQSGVDSNYISLTEFIDLTFGSTLSEEVRQKMKAFLERREAFYQEGRLPNGRWLRMSLDHTDRSERFAFGFLEDFTRTKLAEERSEQYIDIIDSLGAENFALYLVDLETQELEVYRRGEDTTATIPLPWSDTSTPSWWPKTAPGCGRKLALRPCGAVSRRGRPTSPWAIGACSATRSSTWSCASSACPSAIRRSF